ncbi:DUF3325 domain-containing protein (plasmid) [Acidovorax sp. DW039]|uniref:DUF3325 domain-containing protein n=1 Tax=Acidovorax sp. DW039 TaxID=3095606 RepID=UPI0030938348|nr:DUF3325 domain-containing protein [Acidovorax sp. DW039]
MTAWIAWAFCLPAFSALCLAMERHQTQVFGRALSSSASLVWRVLGAALLASALTICIMSHWSLSIAIVAWTGILSFGALGTCWMLTFIPKVLPRVAAMVLVGGIASLGFVKG